MLIGGIANEQGSLSNSINTERETCIGQCARHSAIQFYYSNVCFVFERWNIIAIAEQCVTCCGLFFSILSGPRWTLESSWIGISIIYGWPVVNLRSVCVPTKLAIVSPNIKRTKSTSNCRFGLHQRQRHEDIVSARDKTIRQQVVSDTFIIARRHVKFLRFR